MIQLLQIWAILTCSFLDLTDGLTVKYAATSASDPKAVEPTAVEPVEPVDAKSKSVEPVDETKASEPVTETATTEPTSAEAKPVTT